MAAYRYLVIGRVQGVGYRYFVLREAERLGVTGYARNLPDGSVEVVAEADESVLADFDARLRRGPSLARVEDLERTPITPRSGNGFHIR